MATKTKKSTAVRVVVQGNAAFRKNLIAQARQGVYKTQIAGNAKDGYVLGVQKSQTRVIIVKDGFASRLEAAQFSIEKLLSQPGNRTLARKAA